MKNSKPAAVTQTKPDHEGTLDVRVSLKRSVTYVFHIVSTKDLKIPYAVTVGDSVRKEFKTKPKVVSCDQGRVVVENVEPGQQVALFLNSDAHPSYRECPVYAVTPTDRDVEVRINEKLGKHRDTDTPVQIDGNSPNEAPGAPRLYSAALTGDTWMKVAHKYKSSEVDALLPSGIDERVASAVRSIYDGLKQPSLELETHLPRKIAITFNDGANPSQNIASGYDVLTEGLKRVHPAGFAAIFTAAIDSGVDRVVMTSCWRPMLGSIAHRAGLGLDVAYIGPTLINREELRKEHAPHTSNVSPEEKTLFASFELAKAEQSETNQTLKRAIVSLQNAGDDAGKMVSAKQAVAAATEAKTAADKNRRQAEVAWTNERDKNQPEHVRRFRESLLRNESVTQVFDPWLMDLHTHEKAEPVANMMKSDNERLHRNHLHITVDEPKIL